MLNSGNSYRTFVKSKSKSNYAQKINRNTSQISNTSEVSGYLADFRLQNFENFKQMRRAMDRAYLRISDHASKNCMSSSIRTDSATGSKR